MITYKCLNCRCDLPPGAPMICPTCRQIEAINNLKGSGTNITSGGGSDNTMTGWFLLTAFLVFDAYHHFPICTFIWAFLKISFYCLTLGFFWADPASFGIG